MLNTEEMQPWWWWCLGQWSPDDEAGRDTDHGVSHCAIDPGDVHAVVGALRITCGGRILIAQSALMDSRSWRVACEAGTDVRKMPRTRQVRRFSSFLNLLVVTIPKDRATIQTADDDITRKAS